MRIVLACHPVAEDGQDEAECGIGGQRLDAGFDDKAGEEGSDLGDSGSAGEDGDELLEMPSGVCSALDSEIDRLAGAGLRLMLQLVLWLKLRRRMLARFRIAFIL